ncbi:hypothetical protein [Marmoricola sp. RAF53]|uniref:hypothetical protein n=1 Tax=Marmoricola sp. RAF53 TaxID=3233059 RepID=UPI003F9BA38E
MRTRLGAAVLGVLAGVLLVVGGGLPFLSGEQQEWHRWIATGGYAAAVAALVLVGYGMVAAAPLWLRLIVSIGLPLLAVTLWQVVLDVIDRAAAGWHAEAAGDLAAGGVALVVGLLALGGSLPEPSGYRPTHR